MAQDFDDLEIPAFLKVSQEERAAAWAALDAIKAKESNMIEIAPKTYSGRQEAERAAVQYLAAQGEFAKGKAFDITPAGQRFAITWKEITEMKAVNKKPTSGKTAVVNKETKGKVKRTHAVKDATKLIDPGVMANDFDAAVDKAATSYTVTKVEGRGKRTVKTAKTLPEAQVLAADMGERTMITPVDAKGNGGTPIAPNKKAKVDAAIAAKVRTDARADTALNKPAKKPVPVAKGKQADVDAAEGILTIPDMTAPTYKGVYRATLAAFVNAGKAGDVKAIKAVPMKDYDSGWTMLAKFKARILVALASGKPVKWNGTVVMDPPKVAA